MHPCKRPPPSTPSRCRRFHRLICSLILFAASPHSFPSVWVGFACSRLLCVPCGPGVPSHTRGESCLRLTSSAPSSSCPEPFSLLSPWFVDLGTMVCGREDPPLLRLPHCLGSQTREVVENFAGVLACGRGTGDVEGGSQLGNGCGIPEGKPGSCGGGEAAGWPFLLQALSQCSLSPPFYASRCVYGSCFAGDRLPWSFRSF